jgi:hypothetical protein
MEAAWAAAAARNAARDAASLPGTMLYFFRVGPDPKGGFGWTMTRVFLVLTMLVMG